MELIKNLKVKPHQRLVWTSEAARKNWEAKINFISKLNSELEVASIVAGHRACAWQTVAKEEFQFFSSKILSMGLTLYPVREVARFEGFAHYHEAPKPGEPTTVCISVAKKYSDNLDMRDAYEAGDHEKQGALLGYPPCCAKFFADVWARGYFDPVWQIAMNSPKISESGNLIFADSAPFSNPLLRYVGVRVNFHIPCSFVCERSIESANRRLSLVSDRSIKQDLEALLSMPLSWSVLHGIAEVKSPLFYILTSSVPSAEIFRVNTRGEFLPAETPRGINYPFSLKEA